MTSELLFGAERAADYRGFQIWLRASSPAATVLGPDGMVLGHFRTVHAARAEVDSILSGRAAERAYDGPDPDDEPSGCACGKALGNCRWPACGYSEGLAA